MPTASELSLAFSPKGGSLSPGTLKTSVESLGNGGRVRAASGWKAGTPHYAERSDAQAQESRDLVQLAAEGKVPTKGIIPDAETVSETIKAGPAKQMVDTGTFQMLE